MSAVNGLAIILLNAGYWFGGEPGTISIGWATASQPADAVLTWELKMGPTRLGSGREKLAAGGPWTVKLTPPEVRVRTALRWAYRVSAAKDGASGAELASGEVELHVFPKDLLKGMGKLLASKELVVWDSRGELEKVLSRGEVPHRRIENASALEMTRADVVLIGPDEIDSPFAQAAPLGQAENGAGVMLFAQTRVDVLTGYPVGRRALPVKLEWRVEHPLLASLSLADVQSWLVGLQGRELRPVQLPVDEAAFEVAYWPREAPGEAPVPIDALLASKAMGKGRLVLCQIPLGPWETDPRSQLLLANAINYLLSRPEATPPPSARVVRPPPQPTTVPTITIPSGDKP